MCLPQVTLYLLCEIDLNKEDLECLLNWEILIAPVDSSLRSKVLEEVVSLYHSNFSNPSRLQTQLTLLHEIY